MKTDEEEGKQPFFLSKRLKRMVCSVSRFFNIEMTNLNPNFRYPSIWWHISRHRRWRPRGSRKFGWSDQLNMHKIIRKSFMSFSGRIGWKAAKVWRVKDLETSQPSFVGGKKGKTSVWLSTGFFVSHFIAVLSSLNVKIDLINNLSCFTG